MGPETKEQMALIATPLPGRPGGSISTPLENPASKVGGDDPLLAPRCDEPGVGEDGSCRPIENPS